MQFRQLRANKRQADGTLVVQPGATFTLYEEGTDTLATGIVNADGTPQNPITAGFDGSAMIGAPGREAGVSGRYDVLTTNPDGSSGRKVESWQDTAELTSQAKDARDEAVPAAATAAAKAIEATNAANVAIGATRLYASTADAQADSTLANGATYTVGIIGMVNSSFRAYRKDSSSASTAISNPYPSAASMTGPAIQRIGVVDAPIHGQKTGSSSTRYFGTVAAQDSTYRTVALYNELAGATYKFGAGSKASDTYAPIDGGSWQSVTLADRGLYVITLPTPVTLSAGQVPAFYDPAAIAYSPSLEGSPVASFAGNVVGGTAAASTTNRYQIYFVLEYQQLVVNADEMLALKAGYAGVVRTSIAGAAASTANRIELTDHPAGPMIVSKSNRILRGPDGKAISSKIGPSSVSNIKRIWLPRDAQSVGSQLVSLPGQLGPTLRERGTTPAIDRGGALNFTERSSALMMDGVGSSAFKLIDQWAVPTSLLRPNPTGGATITGLARNSNRYWLASQYGKGVSGDSYNASIMVIDPGFRRCVKEIDLAPKIAGLQGAQDIAINKLNTSQIFILDAQTKKVHRFNYVTGDYVGVALDLSGVANGPSGIAFHSTASASGGLWVCFSGLNVATLYSLETGAATATTVQIQSTADKIFYDEANQLMYAAYGANGSPGNIEVRDTVYGKLVASYNLLTAAVSIEAVYIEDGRIYSMQDTGYHTVDQFSTSTLNTYEAMLPAAPNFSDILTLGLTIRATSVPSSSQAIICEGGPGSATYLGWYLLHTNVLNKLRFTVKTEATGDVRIEWTIPGLLGDGYKHASIRLNRVTGERSLLLGDGSVINGDVVAGTFDTTGVTKPFGQGRICIGNTAFGTALPFTSGELGPVITGTDCVANDIMAELKLHSAGLLAA